MRCGVHGCMADGVRAGRAVGVTVGFARTATDGGRDDGRGEVAGAGQVQVARVAVRESVALAGRAERARAARTRQLNPAGPRTGWSSAGLPQPEFRPDPVTANACGTRFGLWCSLRPGKPWRG